MGQDIKISWCNNDVSPHTDQNGHQQKNLQTINAGEVVKEKEPSCTAGRNVIRYDHYGRWCRDSLKNLEIRLPHDPTIPLPGMHPEKTITEKDMCIPVFTAALFTIARTWKQPGCPSTDERIKKLWYIHTMKHCSALKRMHLSSCRWGEWT